MLVGGEGTRLRPLTLTTPKQMLPIGGRPMIERVLEWLGRNGVDTVGTRSRVPARRLPRGLPRQPSRRSHVDLRGGGLAARHCGCDPVRRDHRRLRGHLRGREWGRPHGDRRESVSSTSTATGAGKAPSPSFRSRIPPPSAWCQPIPTAGSPHSSRSLLPGWLPPISSTPGPTSSNAPSSTGSPKGAESPSSARRFRRSWTRAPCTLSGRTPIGWPRAPLRPTSQPTSRTPGRLALRAPSPPGPRSAEAFWATR